LGKGLGEPVMERKTLRERARIAQANGEMMQKQYSLRKICRQRAGDLI